MKNRPDPVVCPPVVCPRRFADPFLKLDPFKVPQGLLECVDPVGLPANLVRLNSTRTMPLFDKFQKTINNKKAGEYFSYH